MHIALLLCTVLFTANVVLRRFPWHLAGPPSLIFSTGKKSMLAEPPPGARENVALVAVLRKNPLSVTSVPNNTQKKFHLIMYPLLIVNAMFIVYEWRIIECEVHKGSSYCKYTTLIVYRGQHNFVTKLSGNLMMKHGETLTFHLCVYFIIILCTHVILLPNSDDVQNK